MPNVSGVALTGFFASHLIAQLASPERLVAWIGTRAEPGARVYLEWPSPTSNALPTRDELRQHDIEILVSNFRDDPANRTCPDVTTVCGWVREAGFTIVASGAIDLGRFGEELFARAPGQKSPTRSRQSTSPAAACAPALEDSQIHQSRLYNTDGWWELYANLRSRSILETNSIGR